MNRRGFTLVELLAVIAVLAILVIIALPNVLSMFNDARQKSFSTELKEIFKVAQQTWVSDSLLTTSDKIYSKKKDNSCSNSLDLSGRNNLEYYIRIAKSGDVQEFYATDGTFQYSFEGNSLLITDIKDVVQIANMSDSEPSISIECDGVNYDFPNGVTEDPDQGNYFIASRNKYYDTLSDAVNHASSNQTIKVLNGIYETDVVTVPASIRGLKIDLNEWTINFNIYNEYNIINNGELEFINSGSYEAYLYTGYDMQNNGTMKINDGVYISSEVDGIQNNGTVYLVGGMVSSYDSTGIDNSGTVIMSGGTASGYSGGLINRGTFTMTGGKLRGHYALNNVEGKTANISNHSVIDGTSVGIYNSGTVNITDSDVECNYAYHCTGIRNYGTINLTNVTVASTTSGSGYEAFGFINESGGTVIFNNGSIDASTSTRFNSGYRGVGIQNAGTMALDNVNVHGKHHSNTDRNSMGIVTTGNITFTGGEITGAGAAVEIQSGGTLTLGKNDGSVSTTVPLVHGNYRYSEGVRIKSGGTFNFYDGIIKASSGTNYSIVGTGVNTPSGYVVSKSTTSGVETAILTHE